MRSIYAAGFLCLAVLGALCVYSYFEAPRNWTRMPSTDHVIENLSLYEGREVVVDGMPYNVTDEGFLLAPWQPGLFPALAVEAEDSGVGEGLAVNVRGTVEGGILRASEVRVAESSMAEEFVFNVSGLFLFIYMSLKEWKLKREFPFLEEKDA